MAFPCLYFVGSGKTYGIQNSFMIDFFLMAAIFEFKRFARGKWDLTSASSTKRNLVLIGIPALIIVICHVFIIFSVTSYYFYNGLVFHTLVSIAVITIAWDMLFMPIFYVIYKKNSGKNK